MFCILKQFDSWFFLQDGLMHPRLVDDEYLFTFDSEYTEVMWGAFVTKASFDYLNQFLNSGTDQYKMLIRDEDPARYGIYMELNILHKHEGTTLGF